VKPASVYAAWMACLCALGCAKPPDLYEDRDWSKQAGSQGSAWREVESLFPVEPIDTKRDDSTLRGVRLDLTMAKDAAIEARCSCLDVTVGPAPDARFRWSADIPVLSPEQIAVAVRTEGSNCGVADGVGRRPSIYAVDEANGNTIVVIEELASDRPQALGAVVQLPAPGHSLFVRSRRYKDRVLPYAQGPVETSAMCKVMTRPGAAPKGT
jgi:hypothetical protein